MTKNYIRLIVTVVLSLAVFNTPLYAQQETVPQEVADLRARAEGGVAEAQYQLGQIYEGGRGIPGDIVLAVKWYRLAAEQGHPEAKYELGSRYNGGRNIRLDDEQTEFWYRRAAAQGHARAHLNACQR